MVPRYRHSLMHRCVGMMTVPAGKSRVFDLGLSVALHLWTEELRRGEVENWHRFAVELNTLRNDLWVVDPMDGTQPPVTVPVRLGTRAALIAGALSCAAAGAAHGEACEALRLLALEAERVIGTAEIPVDIARDIEPPQRMLPRQRLRSRDEGIAGEEHGSRSD
jgi:hypothetical protein